MPIQQMLLGGGGGDIDGINILFKGKHSSSSPIYGSDLSGYFSAATLNNYDVGVNNIYTSSSFSVFSNGILAFSLPQGEYKIYAKSGDGSGTYSWTGMSTEAKLTLNSTTDLMVLIPNHGMGDYGAGGGLFFIKGLASNYQNSTAGDALLVLGGGGGGYSNEQTFGKAGTLTDNTGTASNRRGPSKGTQGDYDGGAGYLNTYTPSVYTGSSGRAQHFVQGGAGGDHGSCGGSTWGGFGGGGGGCPGGGGGYVGGFQGTEGHVNPGYGGSATSSNSISVGGGGGTSYYNSSFISNLTNTNYGSHNGSGSDKSWNSEFTAKNGYFGIHTI